MHSVVKQSLGKVSLLQSYKDSGKTDLIYIKTVSADVCNHDICEEGRKNCRKTFRLFNFP